jgi:hypothetical protein
MKKIIGSIVAASFLFTGFAAAANISNVEYSNGDVTIQGQAGESVSGKVRIVVGNNEEVEFVQFDVVSDNLAPHCVDTGRLQEGTHFVDLEGVKYPPNTGTYSLNVTAHGIYGGLAADDCVGDQNDSTSFSNSVRTVGGASSSSVGSGSVSSLMALIAELTKQVGCYASGQDWDSVAKQCKAKPAPAKPVFCAALPVVSLKGTSGQYAIQTTLISNGFSIPAGATGYWGTQTDAAYYAAKAQCN